MVTANLLTVARIVGALVLAAIMTMFSFSSFAQQTKTDRLPAYQDFILDLQPDGFVHAHEQGTLNRFIIEYIPKGESLDDWRRMLSIMAPGSADKLPDIENFSAQMFTPMRQACGSLIVSSLSETDVDSRFRVACDPVAPGISIPGGQDLRWEVGIYRFVRTSEALYQIHYVEHGSEALSSSKREQIFSDAAVAVNNVLICRLSDPHPCPPLDRYTLGAIPQSVAGEPPCRSNDSTPCNPAVIFSAPAAQTLTTDETAKKALMVLDFSKEDLLSIERLSHYAGTIIKNLKDGRPGATLIIRGPNPDYSVTTKDRVRVGTFLMVLRSVLIKQGVVDPNAMRFTFMNFR